ncbi:O-antigen ligase family protein [Ectothiorhodospira haloalkaliphila]|nr:O-antigen ligase family protein [Ectothiorhodospira haloalkaliphila]
MPHHLQPPDQPTGLVSYTALLGWYLFAFFALHSPSGAALGLLVTAIASAGATAFLWRDLKNEPIFWISLLLGLYIAARSIAAVTEFPELNEMRNPHWRHFIIISLPIPIIMGWWLNQHQHHVKPILLVAFLGFLVGMSRELMLTELLEIDLSSRYAWGYQPNFLGLIAGAGLIICLTILTLGKEKKSISILLLTIASILFASMIIISQSRSAWLALPIALIFMLMSNWASQPQLRRRITTITSTLIIAPAIIITALHASGNQLTLIDRIQAENETISLIAKGEFSAAAAQGQSVGSRLHMWIVGIEAIRERPVLGWGGGAGQIILSEIKYRHFHNFYIEFTIGYGIAGLVGFLTLIMLMIHTLINARKTERIPDTIYSSVIAITLFTAIILSFEIRVGQPEGRAFLLFLLSFYGLAIFSKKNTKAQSIQKTAS